jgi:hypothetical protein
MLFGLVRVGAVVRMHVRDFDDRVGEASLVLQRLWPHDLAMTTPD